MQLFILNDILAEYINYFMCQDFFIRSLFFCCRFAVRIHWCHVQSCL